MIRPLDIVRTPKGAIAMVTEVNPGENGWPLTVAITRFPHQEQTWEKSAWWDPKELHVLGSLVVLLANEIAHPFGLNGEQGEKYFGK